MDHVFPFEVSWHENAGTLISVQKKEGRYFVRLHKLFQTAPSVVLEAIEEYVLKRSQKAKAVLRQMAHLYFSENKLEPAVLETKGAVYDLQEIYDRLNRSFGLKDVTIGWSNREAKKMKKSITFGTFNARRRQIRLHRLLDQVQVPLYFIEFIVYHEMLHALVPVEMNNLGKCSIHSREFRRREREYPRYLEAKAWEKNEIGRLNGRT